MLNKSALATLEDAEAFQDSLQRGLGDEAHVEYLRATLNWKKFFQPWKVSFHGHTQNIHQTEQQQRAVHVFKFTMRRNLSQDTVIHSEFAQYAEDPRDCVLLTKAFLASGELSQQLCP